MDWFRLVYFATLCLQLGLVVLMVRWARRQRQLSRELTANNASNDRMDASLREYSRLTREMGEQIMAHSIPRARVDALEAELRRHLTSNLLHSASDPPPGTWADENRRVAGDDPDVYPGPDVEEEGVRLQD